MCSLARWFLGLIFAVIVPTFNTVISLRCTWLLYLFRLDCTQFPYSSLCPYHRPFHSARNVPTRQVLGADTSKLSHLRVRLLIVLESRPVQYKGTCPYRHHGQRPPRRCRDHRYRFCYAYPLRRPVADRQAIPPGIMLPVTRFLFCWHPPPIPRLALKHDLARRPCSLRSAKHHAFKLWKERHQAHHKRALPLSSVSVQLRLVLGPRIFVDWTQRVQLGVLDCSE